MNVEIQDVVNEARALGGDEWAQSILAQANEYFQKNMIHKAIKRAQLNADNEKRKWEEEQLLRKAYQDKQREIALKELSEEVAGLGSGNTSSAEGETPRANGVTAKI